MEFNKRLNVKVNPENNAKRLVFTEVIKAEKQVVAGEKYFLTIKATSEDGQTKTYESEMKAVMEFNKRLNVKVNPENNAKRLVFTEVIKAEKQVVAGEKYFLTIKATSEDGQTKTYESEMVGAQLGGAVGGKIPIDDVKTNKEVQDLGRYCVTEYNKGLKMKRNPAISAKMLSFSEVIKAEKQVVAGVKYYLRVKAADSSAAVKTFDAEVFVAPGESSKELVTFAPSTLMRRKF
nr:cysteine proteinase inhibitor B-like [Ipomoea batatas]